MLIVYFGGEAFRRELPEQVGKRIGQEHYGEERQESRLQKAERLVGEGLNRYELGESDLAVLAKGDLRKIEIAQRVREETGATVKWIAERLSMGSVAYVNNGLYVKRKGKL